MLFTNIAEARKAPFVIPRISNEAIMSIAKDIKVVIQKQGKLFYIEEVDPISINFLDNPNFKKEADDLKELITIYTFHESVSDSFEVSMDEVFGFIVDFSNVIAFKTEYLYEGPDGDGIYIGKTTLYIKK